MRVAAVRAVDATHLASVLEGTHELERGRRGDVDARDVLVAEQTEAAAVQRAPSGWGPLERDARYCGPRPGSPIMLGSDGASKLREGELSCLR